LVLRRLGRGTLGALVEEVVASAEAVAVRGSRLGLGSLVHEDCLLCIGVVAQHHDGALGCPEGHLALPAAPILTLDHLVYDVLFVDHDHIRDLLLIVDNMDLEAHVPMRRLHGMRGARPLRLLSPHNACVQALCGRGMGLESGARPLTASYVAVDPLLPTRFKQLLETDSLNDSLRLLAATLWWVLLRLGCCSVPGASELAT